MSERHTLWLLIGRELKQAFRRRGMQVVLAVLFLGAIAGVTLPELIGSDGRPSYTIGLSQGADNPLAETLISAGDLQDADIEISTISDEDDARRQIAEDDLDSALIDGAGAKLLARSDVSDTLTGIIEGSVASSDILDRLEEAGIGTDEAQAILAPPTVEIVTVGGDTSANQGVAALAATIMYLALLAVTISAVNGTASEKSERVSESLLTLVKPATMLLGKVLGVAAVGLAGVAAIAIPLAGKAVIGGGLPARALPTLGLGMVWYLLGVLLYSLLGGTVGSLVERQEEAGTVSQPLILPLIACFLVAQSAADSPIGAVLAYVPFSSPMVEPSRIALGIASWGEMAISAALLVVTIALVQRVAGRVYRRAIVQSGTKVRLRDVLR